MVQEENLEVPRFSLAERGSRWRLEENVGK